MNENHLPVFAQAANMTGNGRIKEEREEIKMLHNDSATMNNDQGNQSLLRGDNFSSRANCFDRPSIA